MTFEREMELFFMRNCFFEKEQQMVRNTPAYRLAEEKNDATHAQEIATRILEARATHL